MNDRLLTEKDIKSIVVGYSAFENGTGWTEENLINIERIIAKTASILKAQEQARVESVINIIKEYKLESASVRDDMLEIRATGWKLLWQALKEGAK